MSDAISKNNPLSQKILFVLNSQEYFRNYIESGALSLIKKKCVFLTGKKLSSTQIKDLGNHNVFFYEYPASKSKLHWHLFNISTKRFINRSKTFKFRFARLPKKWRRMYSFFAWPIFYYLVRFSILFLTFDKSLREKIKKIGPDLIIVPSSGYEGETFEIVKISKKLHIPSLMLTDNWDNLSSKTVFTHLPDYISVWGEQMKKHAVKIHGFCEKNVFILGTPRFRNYFLKRDKKNPSPYSFKFALFAGNSLAFDELSTLRELDKIIEREKLDLKIVYRPHPWRHPRNCPDTFFEYDFKNVILDNDSKKYYKKEFGDHYAPPLDYYPKLLSNMAFMICPLSTMIIEGLLFKKRVFVLAFDDGIHFTNPKNAYKYYEHFKGVDRLENVTIVDNFLDLARMFDSRNNSNGKILEKYELDFFISKKTRVYPKNLQLLTNKILTNSDA